MGPKVTLKDKKELLGQTISGRKYIPDCGNSGEGPRTIKDKCAVDNWVYLICLEHGVGSGDGKQKQQPNNAWSVLNSEVLSPVGDGKYY